ncbi:tyrosine-type recombinase/integrase [Demequina litorisediminis]|uniref:Tyr recombinase domain-containing protein n=1 Tax=Demequina litorisediminis TaxID=1849022 RepID=A0ABQ6IG03_9MICO|nr:tyrosine-type recombinase/integrase [Demequina litorisediminis]GMA36837.1 hypothetical protein GCM10025876_30410 [Demequina litorisediminis]
MGDIARAEGGLLVTVRRSKGDPHGAGQTIAIARGRSPETDPVEALDAWLRTRPRGAGPVFTQVRTNGAVSSHPINAASVVRIVKTRAHAIGFTGEMITAHSLRAGHATAAAMAGVPLDRIAAQTRHRDLAMLVNSYIRPAASMQVTSSRYLGL